MRYFKDGAIWKTWLMGNMRMVWCETHGTIAFIDSRAWTDQILDAIIKKHDEAHAAPSPIVGTWERKPGRETL